MSQRFLKFSGIFIGGIITKEFYEILKRNSKPPSPPEEIQMSEFDQTPNNHRFQLWKDLILKKKN